MTEEDQDLAGTRLDSLLHRPSLKSGIVPGDTRVYLRVSQGPDRGKLFDLSPGGRYVIGRGTGDIPLGDPKVSHRHAELRILGPGAYLVVDLASTNGTFLNGRRVDNQRFEHGDEIRVGDSFLHVDIIEGTIAVTAT